MAKQFKSRGFGQTLLFLLVYVAIKSSCGYIFMLLQEGNYKKMEKYIIMKILN